MKLVYLQTPKQVRTNQKYWIFASFQGRMNKKLHQCLFIVHLLMSVAFCKRELEPAVELDIDDSLNKLQQDDPALIEAVRNLLIRPSDPSDPYNFSVPNPELGGQVGCSQNFLQKS
jgi:hypothetical protein